MSTRAIQHLKRKKIPFELVTYRHDQKGARFAAEAVGFSLEKTIKTLVADLGSKGFVVALMPGNQRLDLKLLAMAYGLKKAKMADTATAERLTGYLVGGISPFGVKKTLPVAMDERLATYDIVMINGGQRGTMLKMKAQDIVRLLNCTVVQLTR